MRPGAQSSFELYGVVSGASSTTERIRSEASSPLHGAWWIGRDAHAFLCHAVWLSAAAYVMRGCGKTHPVQEVDLTCASAQSPKPKHGAPQNHPTPGVRSRPDPQEITDGPMDHE